jgi:hypothetical protein
MELNGDLCSDIIGTNPQYSPIVDHSWLDVDLTKYDNYPSDNNPVRVVPKLHDLWNHSAGETGVNLVPNANVVPLGIRSSEENDRNVKQVVKEAKKAIMMGLKGKQLSEYLKARFASSHIEQAHDDLKKLAEEVGLLGNVYIDASAFNSYHEAEQFLSQHKNRLAQDILINTEGINHNLINTLASTFHKNVVSSVNYNENVFKKYRDHLIQAGRIPEAMTISSKEDLKKAFLFVWSNKENPVTADSKDSKKKWDESKIKEALEQTSIKQSILLAEENDAVLISKVSPIVSFVQEKLSRGKTARDIKEMVRSKFVIDDIKIAAEALSIVMSKEGLSEENINGLIKTGKISMVLGEELIKIGKKYPIKETLKFDTASLDKPIGISGHFYTLSGQKFSLEGNKYCEAAVKAMRGGFDINAVRGKLIQKMSGEEADRIMSEAITLLNSMPAGVVANKAQKQAKMPIVEEVVAKQTLPDPSTIEPQINEILSIYNDCKMSVDIDEPHDFGPLEVKDLFNRSGIDETIK